MLRPRFQDHVLIGPGRPARGKLLQEINESLLDVREHVLSRGHVQHQGLSVQQEGKGVLQPGAHRVPIPIHLRDQSAQEKQIADPAELFCGPFRRRKAGAQAGIDQQMPTGHEYSLESGLFLQQKLQKALLVAQIGN